MFATGVTVITTQDRRPGARHDGERLHVRLAPTAARRDLGRSQGEDARAAQRGAPLRDQRARRRAARALRPLRGPHERGDGGGRVRRRPRDPARSRGARPSRGAGRAFVLGRGPLAVRGTGGVRPVRGGAAAAVPRRAVRAPARARPRVLLAAAGDPRRDHRGRGRADLRAGGVRRSRGRAGRRALRDPRGRGACRTEGEPARDVRGGRVLRRDLRVRRPGAQRGRRRRDAASDPGDLP